MQEYSVPAVATVSEDENLAGPVWANAESHPSDAAYLRRTDDGWTPVSFAAFRDEVAATAKGLLAAGLEPGDRVGLIAKTRYEWTLLDYALWAAGCATLPIYETSSAEQVEWCLSDSGARGVIVETPEHRSVVDGLRDRLPELAHVWEIDGDEPAVGSLVAAGESVSDADLEARRGAVRADDLATLIYTSGTTGRPKGCQITHRNLLFEVRAVGHTFGDLMQPGNRTLLFLPLAHIFARAIQCAAMEQRYTVGHFSDTSKLSEELPRFRPDFLLSVPRVFEKVYNGAKQKAHAGGKGRIFDYAEDVAVAYSRAQDTGGPGLLLRLQYAVCDALVFGKLRAALGGKCGGAVSGGSALGERIGHFFRGIGVPIHEGYGLTETSAACTVNGEGALRVGTVGRPVPGTTLVIADDGEVLVKSPVVFRGYWNNPDATAEAMSEEWFHTGDLGSLDDGYLSITGRKKEIIVTAGGKNVAPAVIEDRIRAHRLVSQALVVGDNRPYVGALVTLDSDALPAWCSEHGKGDASDLSALADDTDLHAEISAAVNEANKAVSKAESVRQFRILTSDFTEESGELTPTLKLKRAVIAEKRSADIEAVYQR